MEQEQHYPYKLEPLPYAYTALTPVIDETTLHFHHDKHLQTYVDNLNKALENAPEYQQIPLDQLLKQVDTLPETIRTAVKNNGGGVFNHQLYFRGMTNEQTESSVMQNAIKESFGSIDNWAAQMRQAAISQFGSGWAWLAADTDKKLKVINTPNQDAPLSLNLCPLLLVDVWEHAYYLQYQNRRADYVDCWFSLINWKQVENNYNC